MFLFRLASLILPVNAKTHFFNNAGFGEVSPSLYTARAVCAFERGIITNWHSFFEVMVCICISKGS